jgi:hypothetical protein
MSLVPQSLFCRPSFSYAASDGMLVYSCYSAPFSDGMGFPARCYASVVSFVVGLLQLRRPSAVVLGIRAFVIYSVQALIGRSNSHVIEEVLKRAPTLINGYTPSSIIGIIPLGRSSASIEHVPPAAPRPRMGKSVGFACRTCSFFLEATATLGMAICKVVEVHLFRGPARASNDGLFTVSADYGQSSVGLCFHNVNLSQTLVVDNRNHHV